MKVRCPKHDDSFPSCEVYEEGAYCFAGCGMIPLSQLGLEGLKYEVRPIEDVETTIRQLELLPRASFRGFTFPFDLRGFYILWPNAPFYKQRLFEPKGSSKYRGPGGHKPPLFWARSEGGGSLLVVEGELEALSAAEAIPEWDVVSPGSASQFTGQALVKACLPYHTVVVVSDNDAPGAKAARELASELLYKVPKLMVFYKDKDKDFNKILVEYGKEGLREEIKNRLHEAVCWENY